jgi:hypothetical protein
MSRDEFKARDERRKDLKRGRESAKNDQELIDKTRLCSREKKTQSIKNPTLEMLFNKKRRDRENKKLIKLTVTTNCGKDKLIDNHLFLEMQVHIDTSPKTERAQTQKAG